MQKRVDSRGRLLLCKETLRELTGKELRSAAGGSADPVENASQGAPCSAPAPQRGNLTVTYAE